MASSSTFPPDDDDEFDWEAAVREIDVACEVMASTCNQEARPSTHIPIQSSESNGLFAKLKFGSGFRQATLDRFIKNEQIHSMPKYEHVGSSSVSYKVDDCNDGGVGDLYAGIDMEAAKTWIYPVNVPLREYQLNITKTALFSNTLVVLPTGLGKTLIAAVVMYNYFRWFPQGKIVFAAPSRPLVLQQIEACHNTVGMPQEWTIDLTGKTTPSKRLKFWRTKRVFFVTPQVLEKDIRSGTCLVNQLVCLVIDEAHRAMGNYAYCVAVRELMAVPVQMRILALTATPGAKQYTIQKVIDNLHITTIECRREDDHDVSPYVHNRQLELLEVPMGNDAVEITNLLLEAIRPFVAKLCTFGVLTNRDVGTLSPCELLNLRDRFRKAPPLGLPPARSGEIEGCFAVLITLYHIRKLLSSHGIRPAYEMLEDKLQRGQLARLMGKNELMWKAKLLMQQSLSHGAPTPKILKMIDVLLDHFKTKDPKVSRVIIFSNFRGSVKDIMDSLKNIGDLVRATQFIGQSSGKTSKGQSQKMQQEVLQQFRSGGYNVIVATSIGEEGLDIMEVDLVICFDANISPLRMIQRMGRTGRKHDGRVVVLACEGSELKGYLRKQANSKAVRKHMHNGGINSFDFHDSPRMVPHICKPEVQFVKLSIEQFVPRGKKLKDNTIDVPAYNNKISDAEEKLISKYFGPSRHENLWKPSLIAFPCFQAIPSSVYKVKHSSRTTQMLIDTMGQLQGLSAFKIDQALSLEVQPSSDQIFKSEIAAQDDCNNQDESQKTCGGILPCRADVAVEPFISLEVKDNTHSPESTNYIALHCFLFSADLVSVDPLGKVLVTSVPTFPFIGADTNCYTVPQKECILTSSMLMSINNQAEPLHTVEKVVTQTPVLQTKISSIENDSCESPADVDIEQENIDNDELHDFEFSPRLSNYFEKGVVPESPIIRSHDNSTKLLSRTQISEPLYRLHLSPTFSKMSSAQSFRKLSVENSEEFIVRKAKSSGSGRVCSYDSSPLRDIYVAPVVDHTHHSSSEDWRLSSGEVAESIQQDKKFKRLRKYGDIGKKIPSKTLDKEFEEATEKHWKSFTRTNYSPKKHPREKQSHRIGIGDFIEEEAKVSSDAEVSADEEDNKDDEQYADSFIDDRTDPTTTSSHAEAQETDMIAFYRRSLLSQSPTVCLPNYLTSLNNISHSPKTVDCGSCSSNKVNGSHVTPPSVSYYANHSSCRNSVSCQVVDERIGQMVRECETSELQGEDESKAESRKRKLDFLQAGALSSLHDQKEQAAEYSEAVLQHIAEENGCNAEEFFDDKFYEGLDLDAVEAQATKFLKSNLTNKPLEVSDFYGQVDDDLTAIGLPSFNLGI